MQGQRGGIGMRVLVTAWIWWQTRLAAARRGEDGWGAIEWMVIIVSVVGLAYAANKAAGDFLEEKAQELF